LPNHLFADDGSVSRDGEEISFVKAALAKFPEVEERYYFEFREKTGFYITRY